MKKLLLTAFAAISLQAVSAQSVMEIPAHASVVTGTAQSGNVLTARLALVNTGTQPIEVRVARKIIREETGSENVFCWTNCYLPTVSISPDTEIIAPGDTNTMFYADYSPNGFAGKTIIRYSFFRVGTGTPDSVHATIEFNATTTTGVKNNVEVSDLVTVPSPNPANHKTTIGYTLPANTRNAKLKVYNAIGGLVKEVNLTEKQGNLVLMTEALPSGMYFYTLQADNRSLTTKKLVVKH